jgi:hypothetical protein
MGIGMDMSMGMSIAVGVAVANAVVIDVGRDPEAGQSSRRNGAPLAGMNPAGT